MYYSCGFRKFCQRESNFEVCFLSFFFFFFFVGGGGGLVDERIQISVDTGHHRPTSETQSPFSFLMDGVYIKTQ